MLLWFDITGFVLVRLGLIGLIESLQICNVTLYHALHRFFYTQNKVCTVDSDVHGLVCMIYLVIISVRTQTAWE